MVVKRKPVTRMSWGFWLTVGLLLVFLAAVVVLGAYYANGKWGLQ
jgi:hypothetical protein